MNNFAKLRGKGVSGGFFLPLPERDSGGPWPGHRHHLIITSAGSSAMFWRLGLHGASAPRHGMESLSPHFPKRHRCSLGFVQLHRRCPPLSKVLRVMTSSTLGERPLPRGKLACDASNGTEALVCISRAGVMAPPCGSFRCNKGGASPVGTGTGRASCGAGHHAGATTSCPRWRNGLPRNLAPC